MTIESMSWMSAGISLAYVMLSWGKSTWVRSKNASMQSLKNVALFSVAGLMFWLVGYNMAYPADAGGWAR